MSAAEFETAGPAPPADEMNRGELTDRLASLSPDKRALLERLLLERRRVAADTERGVIPRRTGAGPWPLSHAQELMWLLDQLSPGGNAYNSPAATRLEGPLDIPALQHALDAVVGRNEVLRTTYDAVDGRPMQVVHPPYSVALPVIDLSGVPAARRLAELDRLLKKEAERPYDLGVDRVLRSALVRLGADDHVLLLVLHHIAIDGWSKGVLWRELTAYYDAYVAGREPDLAPLRVQYADWAGWHRAWLDGVVDEQLKFWQDHLAGAPALLDLPTDYPRPQVRSGRGDRRDTMFPADTLDRLRELARAEQATLFMAVLAVFGVLLGRYSGQDRVVIGTPIAGRNRVEIEDVVGYFMNTLALHVDLRGDPTFRQLLRRVRENTISAFANQDVPFEWVVAELNPERDLSRTPLFQAMLVLQNQKRSELHPVGLVATPIRHERGWAKFDLTVGMGERETGLNTSWEFSTDLFEAATVERMMDGFGALLEAVVASPDRAISDLSTITRDQLTTISDWEDGGPALGTGRVLGDLVSDRALTVPAAPAISDGDLTLSYAELLAAADVLAARLRRLGVRPGTPVGVCADRSVHLTIGLLAVLRAGGACVPLDPAYPPERLRLMIADTAAPVVLVTPSHRHRLPRNGAVVTLEDSVLSASPAAAAEARAPVPEGTARPDGPAYILYTSGSTGRPKGVVLPHAGLVNHALAAAGLYGLGPGDRVLQFASPSFDISIEEIFATLAAGACVVPWPVDLPLGGWELLDWLERERITVLDLPTAYWQEWVRNLVDSRLPLPRSLRLVVVGGQKASASSYAAWRLLAGDRVAWINTYGPTETSVVATAWQPGSDLLLEGREPPIGRPLRGVRVRVLDGRGNRVPVGVRGELHVGGIGLAQGYLHDRELTGARFGSDPEVAGERLYRTGDLVRWSATGTLVYAGRTDDQVKLRGFRIEPGEVESTLSTHQAVAESVALVSGRPGLEQLVAYAVVPDPTQPDLGQVLRDYLSERLPAYVVPTAVIPVQSLPLTPNGKLDADALPAPTPAARADERPRDDVERRLHDVWCSVLGLESVGMNENFFHVGGHSLPAVRLFARIEKAFGLRLPLATLIAAQSVAELAAVIRAERPAPSWRSLVPLNEGGHRAPLFLVHHPNGQVLVYRDLIRRLGPDQPVYGLQSVGLDAREHPLTRIEDMATHYVSELRTIQPRGPYLLGGFCYGGVVALEMAAQLRTAGEHVALVAMFNSTPYGHGVFTSELFKHKVRRRMREWANTNPRNRLPMIPETARRTYERLSRKYVWPLAKHYLLEQGRALPRPLRSVYLVNYMAMKGYTTPRYEGPAVLILANDGLDRAAIEARTARWQSVTTQLQVREVCGVGITHNTMLCDPYAGDLALQLGMSIDEALNTDAT